MIATRYAETKVRVWCVKQSWTTKINLLLTLRLNHIVFIVTYIRSKKKVKDHIEYLIKADGTKTSSDAEVAEVLAEFFGSVYVREDAMNIPTTVDNFWNRSSL